MEYVKMTLIRFAMETRKEFGNQGRGLGWNLTLGTRMKPGNGNWIIVAVNI